MLKVFCPRHPKEQLRVMFCHQLNPKNNQGRLLRTDWLYCKKCEKPYKVKISVR